jgi:hypothetical protein
MIRLSGSEVFYSVKKNDAESFLQLSSKSIQKMEFPETETKGKAAEIFCRIDCISKYQKICKKSGHGISALLNSRAISLIWAQAG